MGELNEKGPGANIAGGTRRGVFVLEGSFSEADEMKLEAIKEALRKITGDATLTIQYAEAEEESPSLGQRFQDLLDRIQSIPDVTEVSDEEIAAEIEAYRRGE